jgi:hypothetical protein
MLGSKQVTLRITLNWLIGIAVVAVGLIVAYAFWIDGRPTLIFAAAVIGGSGALLNAVNGVDARASQVAQAASQGAQAKKAAALDFITRWLDPPFFYVKRSGRELIAFFRAHRGLEDQRRYLGDDANADRTANLFDIFNLFEEMSIAIQTDMVDEDILKRFFRSLVLEYWHIFEAFMGARRAERNNARLLIEAEWLYRHWRS